MTRLTPSPIEVVHAAAAGSHVLRLGGGEYLVTHPKRAPYIVGRSGEPRDLETAKNARDQLLGD